MMACVHLHLKICNLIFFRLKRDAEQGTCGSSNEEVHRWMTSIQNSAIEKDDEDTLVSTVICVTFYDPGPLHI